MLLRISGDGGKKMALMIKSKVQKRVGMLKSIDPIEQAENVLEMNAQRLIKPTKKARSNFNL